LKALNQPFRGFLCYQGLEADFVSLHSREAPGEACLSASASRAASRRPSLSSILSASPLWKAALQAQRSGARRGSTPAHEPREDPLRAYAPRSKVLTGFAAGAA
jgi:hypothetical protein